MKRLFALIIGVLMLLILIACGDVTRTDATNPTTSPTTPATLPTETTEPTEATKSTESATEPTENPETVVSIWDSCPVIIQGGISGSSYSESFKLKIENITSKDIDAVKLLFVFTHSDYDGSQMLISGYYTVDTIWGGESVSETISAAGYNFLRATIYPVCIYFKDGTVWGVSSATYEEIVENSVAFEIEHYAFSFG